MLNAAPDPKSTPIRAIREQALGFELAQRRPYRGLGNLQLRAQADHPGQLAPPLPGSQPLAQMAGGLICEREAGIHGAAKLLYKMRQFFKK